MNAVDKDYELQMIKMALNKYLDETISVTEKDFERLKDNRDRTVWDLTARIYVEIGHKVELSTVRDIVNERIEAIKCQLERHRQPKLEETYRVAQPQYIADIERQDTEEDADFRSKVTTVLGKFGGDEGRARVFVRVRKVISERLEVDESEINLDSHMSNHLKADELDLFEIVMSLEEEFDIEISDESVDFRSYIGTFSWVSGLGTSSLSLSFTAGEECLVRSFVEIVHNIISN